MVKFFLKSILCNFFASVDNRTAGKLLMAKYLESYGSKKYDLPYMLEINLTTRKYFKFNNKKTTTCQN